MRSSVLLSDSAFHLFLQSDLSTKEIDQRLSEELPPRTLPLSSYNASPIIKRAHLPRSVSCTSDGNSEDNMGEALTFDDGEISSSFDEGHDDNNDYDMSD